MTTPTPTSQTPPQPAPTPNPTPDTEVPARPRRKLVRRLFYVAVGGLLAVFVMVALLPTLLSTGPGKNLVLGLVNGALDGRVEAQSLSLGWFSGQKAAGVEVTSPGGTHLVQNMNIDAPSLSLFSVAMGSRNLGDIHTTADAIALNTNAQGKLDLPGAAAKPSTKPASKPTPSADPTGLLGDIDTRITVKVGKITYQEPGQPTRELRDADLLTELQDGRKLNFAFTAQVIDPAGDGQLDIKLNIDGLTDAAGKSQPDKATIDADITIKGVSSAMLAAVSGVAVLPDYLGPTLNTHATAKGTLSNFTADVTLPDLTLPAGEGKTLALTSGRLDVRPGAAADTLALNWRGQASAGGVTESVSLDATLAHLFDDTPMGIVLAGKKLPVPLLDALGGLGTKLTATVGDTMDFTLNVAGHEQGGYAFDGSITAPRLRGPIAGRYFGEEARTLIEVQTPSPLSATLTPAAYDLWTADAATGKPANYRLGEALSAALDVTGLRLVMLPTPEGEDAGPLGVRLDAAQSWVAFELSSPRGVVVRGEPAGRFAYEPFVMDVRSRNLASIEIVSQLQAMVEEAVRQSQPAPPGNAPAPGNAPGAEAGVLKPRGLLDSKTTVQNLFDARGVMAWRGATIDSRTTMTDVPATLPDMLANQGGKLAAMTGELITGDAVIVQKPGQPGTLVANVDATNLKGRIPARITDDGFIELSDDITLSLVVTEETSRSWLGGAHPLFADAVASEPGNPVRVVVKKEDVRIPTDGSFDIATLKMQGSINPGTLLMRRSGWIDQAASALVSQIAGRQVDRRGEVKSYAAAFSPMNFALRDGVVTTSELWMVSEDMGIGFQGSVDLTTNQIQKMGVGILGGTFMAMARGDRQRIDPQGVWEVPISGSVSAPRPDLAGLFVANLDQILDTTGRNVDGEAGQWIGLGKVVLGEIGKKRGKEGKYTYNWSPTEPAQAFAAQFKPPPVETAAQPQDAGATQDEPQAPPEQPRRKTEEELAREVLRGIFGGGR